MDTSLTPVGPEPGDRLPYLPEQAPPPVSQVATQDDSQTANLMRALQALKRFRWTILGLTVIGLGGGILATRYIKPLYEVEATIWIETQNPNQAGTPIQGQRLLQSRAWVELLRAYKVLDPVVQDRKLYLSAAKGPDSVLFRGFDLTRRFLPGEYEYEVGARGGRYSLRHLRRLVSEEGSVGDSVGRQLGLLWVPRPSRDYFGKKVRFEVQTPRQASNRLAGRLQSVLREDNFLRLSLTGTDPAEAASTMNSLISRFVEEAATQKRQQLTLLAGVLDSQVTEQAQKLQTAEEALEAFRVQTVTMPREEAPIAPGLQLTQPTVYTQYFQLRTDLENTRRDREAIEAVLARSRQGSLEVDAFNTIPSVRGAPDLLRVLNELSTAESELRRLLTLYTDQHPQVRDARDRISVLRTQTIPLYAQALVAQLRITEDDLSQRIATASRELRLIPTRSQNEARLTREVQQADELFRSLERNRQQANLAEASAIPDVRILDSAVVPTRPSKNSAPSLILIGLVAGLGLGVALALVIDRLDRRVRYPDQVVRGLGLPILGTIPQIRHTGNGAASHEAASQVIESFRSVRLNLAHSFPQGTGLALTISSPSPGDGKSLVSANLALSFAEAGYRTVLIDGDIRRGDLHRTFHIERVPGLVDHLAGEADPTAILRPTSHARLMVLPAGRRRRDAPELLGSARMRDLMAIMRARFDVILVDTPPLGAGIDPFVLSTATGSLVLVLRAGETDRQLAEAKLQVLDRLPVRLLGAILNDVRVGEGAYRYYSYSYGYLADDEEPAPEQLPKAGTPS